MATRRPRGSVNPLTAEALDGCSYDDLVAAWAAVAVRWAGNDPGLVKFRASWVEYEAIIARLEVLAATDPRIVDRVQRASNRQRSAYIGGHLPGDLGQAEAAMCLAAHRRSTYLTDTGFGSRGPFRPNPGETTRLQRASPSPRPPPPATHQPDLQRVTPSGDSW